MSHPGDLVELVSGFVETFGRGVRVNNLRLNAMSGWQMGESIGEWVKRTGGYLEVYEHNMPGFGPLIASKTDALPAGWARHGDVPRGAHKSTKQSTSGIKS